MKFIEVTNGTGQGIINVDHIAEIVANEHGYTIELINEGYIKVIDETYEAFLQRLSKHSEIIRKTEQSKPMGDRPEFIVPDSLTTDHNDPGLT